MFTAIYGDFKGRRLLKIDFFTDFFWTFKIMEPALILQEILLKTKIFEFLKKAVPMLKNAKISIFDLIGFRQWFALIAGRLKFAPLKHASPT